MLKALFLAATSFLGVMGLIIYLQYFLSNRQQTAKKRLENYLTPREEAPLLTPLKEEKKTREKKRSRSLKKSDFFLITALCAFSSCLFFFFSTGNLVFALLFGVLGSLIPTVIQRQQQTKKAKLFNSQLPDTLTLASNSLKAGYSFLQAMDVVAREMPPPISEEFARALKEANLGVPIEDALMQITKRVESEDLELVITAVVIQRQVGGNLASILDNITETIRERVRIKGEIKTLTAQGKISGLVIGGIPFCLGLYLYATNPKYIGILFTHPLGLIILGMAFLSQIIGTFFIYKIVNIEV